MPRQLVKTSFMPKLKHKYQRSFASISMLSLSGVANAVLAFAVQLMLARIMQPAEYGALVAALASIALIAPIVGFGLPHFWLRLLSESEANGQSHLVNSARLLLVSGLVGVLMVWIWAAHNSDDALMATFLAFLSVGVLANTGVEFVFTQFQYQKRQFALAIMGLSQNALRFVSLVVMVLVLGRSIDPILIGALFSLVSLILLIFSLYLIFSFVLSQSWFNLRHGCDNTERKTIYEIATQSLPFGLAMMFQLVYYQVDVVMLKAIIGSEEAGIYNVAFIVVASTYIIPTAVFQKYFLPKVHEWAYRKPEMIGLFINRAAVATGGAGLIISFFLWQASDLIISRFFGPDFAGAVGLIQILCLGITPIYIAYCFGTVLMTRNNMASKTIIMAVVAVANVVLNFILIPKYGAEGAAVATAATALLLLVLYYLKVRSVLK